LPKEAKAVFVYGTLRVGGFYAGYFDGLRLSAEKATIKGDLYKGLPFPFIDIRGDGVVHGEVHTYEDFERVMRGIDNIEGFVEEGNPSNLYDRVVVEATFENGEKVDAYVYHMTLEKADLYVQPWMKLRKVLDGVWEI
jgi:gamma-glutamylcyclotransferase (GGCT)/AIG2-like uncharacterized protein YtfP